MNSPRLEFFEETNSETLKGVLAGTVREGARE